jgi:aryl-alcohol dehydrogenase-like predicted oxidoreductase
MKYRKLGKSDLSVSEISLGSWLTYGVGVAKDAAVACVDRAFDLGINFIDTANVYGRGAAEAVLGEVLAKRPRDSYVLAAGVGRRRAPGKGSLHRLQRVVGGADRRRTRRRRRRPLRVEPAAILAAVAWPGSGVMPLSAAKGISQIVWSPLAQGVLSGKYLPGVKLPDQSRATSESAIVIAVIS